MWGLYFESTNILAGVPALAVNRLTLRDWPRRVVLSELFDLRPFPLSTGPSLGV